MKIRLLREKTVKTVLVVIDRTAAYHAPSFLVEPEMKVVELGIKVAKLAFDAFPGFH